MINAGLYIDRRNRLYEEMEDNSFLLVLSGSSKQKTGDSYYKFEVNRNFYYLTGIDEENSAFLAIKHDGKVDEYLFVVAQNEFLEKFTGKLLSFDEARKISGVEAVYSYASFESELQLLIEGKKVTTSDIRTFYGESNSSIIFDANRNLEEYKNLLLMNYPMLKFVDIKYTLTRFREKKAKEEVYQVQEACRKLNGGLKDVMKNLRPGICEFNISNYFDSFVRQYGKHPFYRETFVAAGENTLFMVNREEEKELKEKDLLIIDAAVLDEKYVASVARTYPVCGKFSEEYKLIYQKLLDTCDYALNVIKPGSKLEEVNEIIYNYFAESLLNSKILREESEVRHAIPRILLNEIGLDEKDPISHGAVISEGNLFTLDLGIYSKLLKQGVRLKDIIFVTENGCMMISKDALREVVEIETALKNRKV